MTDHDAPPPTREAPPLTRALLSALVAAALLASLPAALVSGLAADLRHLASTVGGPERLSAGGAVAAEILPRSVVSRPEPKAVLPSHALGAARADATSRAVGPAPHALPEAPPLPEGGTPAARGLARDSGAPDGRPPPRAYDPIGPPLPA